MTDVAEDEAEEEANNLKLIIATSDEPYDRELVNVLDLVHLGLKTPRVERKWWRDRDDLGFGAYGVVYRERWKEDKRVDDKGTRVVKVIDRAKIQSGQRGGPQNDGPKYQDTGLFVYFHGWYESANLAKVTLVMEDIPRGNLGKWVENHGGKLAEDGVIEIASQMLTALKYMHEDNFIHRDLKPEVRGLVLPWHDTYHSLCQDAKRYLEHFNPKGGSSLVDQTCGFRLLQGVTARTVVDTYGGTKGYIAPEISLSRSDDAESSEYSHLVDIWSAGCVIFRLLSGVVPEDHAEKKKFQKQSDIPDFLKASLLTVRQEAADGPMKNCGENDLFIESILRNYGRPTFQSRFQP
ncbi:hypothetical protein LTR84_011928 [Exophiala bonariae]|uniref:Protein kinase domain-containing protein n=1 Tax=Exophiala bonariae TaxID=1690606 RepID=A0AAV9MU93_9EURO|nr:hypothetical protein LTR84_011928 [Exophiala bonariae]